MRDRSIGSTVTWTDRIIGSRRDGLTKQLDIWGKKKTQEIREKAAAENRDPGLKEILYLHFTMDDNLSLSEKIKERYRSMYTGVFYRRYIRGLWAMAEGIIYDMFDTAKHVISNLSDLVNTNYYVSCDYGTQNATVFLLWCKECSDGGCVAGVLLFRS